MSQEVVHPPDRAHDVRLATRVGRGPGQRQRCFVAHERGAVAPRRVLLIPPALPDIHQLTHALHRWPVRVEIVQETLGLIQISDRVGVGKEPGRGVRGKDEEGQRLGLEPRGQQIVRDDAGVLFRFTKALGKELPDHRVIFDPELRRNAGVENFPDLRMVEVVLGSGGMDQVMDLLEELERFQERHALELEAAQDGAGVEDVPFHGAQFENFPLPLPEPAQAPHHHVVDLVGDGDLVHRGGEGPGLTLLGEDLLRGEQLQYLHHEEGIPLRLAEEKIPEFLAPVVPRVEPLQHLRNVGAAQARQVDPLEPVLAPQELEHALERMRAAPGLRDRLLGPIGHEQEHAASRHAAREEVEQADRPFVRPLQILDHEHQGTLLRDERDDLVQHFPQLFLAGGSVRDEREAKEAAQHGNGAREARRAVEEEALEGGSGVHAPQGEILPERIGDREVGAAAAAEETGGDQHAAPLPPGALAELLHEAALSDARLPRDAGPGPLSHAHLAVERGEPFHRLLAAHHGRQEPLAARREHLARRDQIQLLVDSRPPEAVVLAEPRQILRHLRRALVALLRVLHHRLHHDVLEVGGHLGDELADRDRVLVQDGVRDRDSLIADEGEPPGQELVHDDPEREEVRPAVHLLPGDLLRRHVGRRPQDGVALGERASPRDLGQPEVHHLDAPFRGALDVRALDVAVNDAVGMRLPERVQDLEGHRHDLAPGKRPRRDQFAQGDPRHVFHREEDVFPVGPHLVDDRGVGMVERGGRSPLVQEAAARLDVA